MLQLLIEAELPEQLRELVLDEWAEQRMLKSLADARDLLASRRYEESMALLSALRKEFPLAEEISKLLATAEQERAEQERRQRLVEARALLTTQHWDEALALMDSLLAAQPKDAAALKLKTLVQNELEKQAKSERLKREWELLKELTGKEAYPEVVARAEQLLRDFPGDGDLLRLLEFAHEQQTQREQAIRLRKTLDEVEGHLKANHLPQAIAAANSGLASFPQNADLNRLREQAVTRQKKEQTRQAIEQRVREIKTKINREEYSDAIQLAKNALATLGPDTDVTQLLSSAEVEYNAREKNKGQDRKLESVRTLLESGNLEGATLLFDETIKSQKLDPDDPRVQRLSEEIAAAITATAGTTHPVAPPPPQSPVREYALLEGPPLAPESLLPEGSSQRAIAAKASASQAPGFSQPIAPPPPPRGARIPISPAVRRSQPQQPVAPKSGPKSSLPPPRPPTPPPEIKGRSSPSNAAVTGPLVSVPVGGDPSASPSPDVPLAPVRQEKRLAPVSVWRKPAILATALLGLILLASSVVHLLSPNQSMVARNQPAVPPPPPGAPAPEPAQPKVSLPEPPPPGTSNAALTALWEQEEQLWSRAKAETENARFTQAQQDLGRILSLPAGGRRKGDARNYLDQVIPKRQREERLFAEAQQALRQNDPSGLQHAADLFAQVVTLGGPRQRESQKLQSDAQASLATLNALSVASLTDSARQDLNRGDFRSARQRATQIQQTGGDPSSLTAEINQAEQTRFVQLENSLNQLKQRGDDGAVQLLRNLQTQFQTLAESGGPTANDARRDAASIPGAISDLQARLAAATSAEEAFQKALKQYQGVKETNDRGALEASRNEFQSIARSGGAHTGDAQRLLGEINSKIIALGTALAVAPDDTPAIRAVVQQYAIAFEQRDADALRKIWPSMSKAEYDGSRGAFSAASAIRMRLSIEKVVEAPDHATATVTTDIAQDYTPKGNKAAMRKADHAVFYLVKQNGTWVIKDRQ